MKRAVVAWCYNIQSVRAEAAKLGRLGLLGRYLPRSGRGVGCSSPGQDEGLQSELFDVRMCLFYDRFC